MLRNENEKHTGNHPTETMDHAVLATLREKVTKPAKIICNSLFVEIALLQIMQTLKTEHLIGIFLKPITPRKLTFSSTGLKTNRVNLKKLPFLKQKNKKVLTSSY